MLVRLATFKRGRFDLPSVQHDASRDDTKGDVRAIEPMMCDGRFWNVHAARSMHEGGGTEGRFARQARIDVDTRVFAEGIAVGGRKLHKEIVWVLTVDQMRSAVRRLTGCK